MDLCHTDSILIDWLIEKSLLSVSFKMLSVSFKMLSVSFKRHLEFIWIYTKQLAFWLIDWKVFAQCFL